MIVVTGATGRYGRLAAGHLLRRGVPADRIVAAARTPAKAADLAGRGVPATAERWARHARPDWTACLDARAVTGASWSGHRRLPGRGRW